MVNSKSSHAVSIVFLCACLSSSSSTVTVLSQVSAPIEILGGEYAEVHGDVLVYTVSEVRLGEDANGDGDTDDQIFHVRDLVSGETKNLRLPHGYCWCQGPPTVKRFGNRLVLSIGEWTNQDLNADGDREDNILHLHDLSTGETTNLGFAGFSATVESGYVIFSAREQAEGKDLNGDDDTEDSVAHVHDLATGQTTNLGFAGWIVGVVEHHALVVISEQGQGDDLNGDGDVEDYVTHRFDLSTGRMSSLGISTDGSYLLWAEGRWVVYALPESTAGEDLNGDGDTIDAVLQVLDSSTGETTNLGLVSREGRLQGDWLVIDVRESDQAVDLDGDGRLWGYVTFVHDPSTGETTNLGLVGANPSRPIRGERVVIEAREREGEDFDGDGESNSTVVHVHDLSAGETVNLGVEGDLLSHGVGRWLLVGIGSGSDNTVYSLETGETHSFQPSSIGDDDYSILWHAGDWVAFVGWDEHTQSEAVFIHDLQSGKSTALGDVDGLGCGAGAFGCWEVVVVGGLSHSSFERWVLMRSSEELLGRDSNGDGDTLDPVYALVGPSARGQQSLTFIRGDDNDDGTVDITDPITSLEYQFLGLGSPGCLAALDTNADTVLDITDPIYNLEHQFLGKPAPPAPYPGCGPESLPAQEALPCETPPADCR